MILSTTETDGAGETTLFSFNKGLEYTGGQPAITLVVKDSDGRVRRMLFGKQKLRASRWRRPRPSSAGAIETPRAARPGSTSPGPTRTIPYVSLVDVERNQFRPEAVRGKVVIVGATATSLQDQHNTVDDAATL